jgi:hypothetical protein
LNWVKGRASGGKRGRVFGRCDIERSGIEGRYWTDSLLEAPHNAGLQERIKGIVRDITLPFVGVVGGGSKP